MMPAGSIFPAQLADIAQCESGLQQYHADGTLVKNPTSTATGVFQIMRSVHEPMADKMGLDLTKAADNISYGIWLYNREGTKPWEASSSCWKKPVLGYNENI